MLHTHYIASRRLHDLRKKLLRLSGSLGVKISIGPTMPSSPIVGNLLFLKDETGLLEYISMSGLEVGTLSLRGRVLLVIVLGL